MRAQAGGAGAGANAGAAAALGWQQLLLGAPPLQLRYGLGLDKLRMEALHRSMILSVDMAHAVHPNYASKHEKFHAPKMNEGIEGGAQARASFQLFVRA